MAFEPGTLGHEVVSEHLRFSAGAADGLGAPVAGCRQQHGAEQPTVALTVGTSDVEGVTGKLRFVDRVYEPDIPVRGGLRHDAVEDEHDPEEGALWSMEAPGCYLAEARAPLDEFEADTGLHFDGDGQDEDEIETLGGLVFLLLGHVPTRGEVVTHSSGVEFEIVDADPRRIKRLRIRVPDQLPDA